ncbi:MAG: hypothetical protein KKB90_09940 [Actinobacteria bacterium]|nr:hypothetical protein [Actinomycetota bacterium]MCG2819761.1 hypothetical protein [Actinomycetes bacterium]MBU4178671.1 hypothetical protein [Actinomycetota bacterium]MBU4219265.1 hypothetical protein [Actinomycetota bacterium]MBU4359549.1 hypothetical protein [Actinomycetota bacterium]
MSKTFPLDFMLSLGLGMMFSMAQDEKEKEKASVFRTTYFKVGLAYHFVVAFGVAFACYMLYPDWMLMYYADSRKVPRPIIAYIFSGYFAMYTLGFLVVPPLREKRRERPRRLFIYLMVLIFAFIWFSFHRLWHVGSYRGYYLGDTRPITRTSLFPVLGVSMPMAVGALIAVLHMLRGRFPETAVGPGDRGE